MTKRDEIVRTLAAHRINPDFWCTCGADFFLEDREEELDADPNAFLEAFEAHLAATLELLP